MSFLFPAFLIGALAIGVPVMLHLWKGEAAPRVAFSDIRLLGKAPVLQTSRRRFRELLLLILRIAALLFLVLAFARPFFDVSGVLSRDLTVVALDRSFSMGGPEAFQRARAAATAAVVNAPPDHVVGLVVFDHQARVAYDATLDRSAVVARLADVTPGSGATRFAAAVDTAVEMFGSRVGRIVVVTDLQQTGWERTSDVAVPPGVVVEVSSVASSGANLAVTSMKADPRGISAVVFNSGTERSTIVSLHHDGRLLTTGEVLAPSGSTEVNLDVDLPSTGALQLTVDDSEGVPADDRRYLILDPPSPVAVGVVTNGGRIGSGAFYLERALSAGEGEHHFEVVAIGPDVVATRELSGLEVIVIIGTQGLTRAGREKVAAYAADGGGVMVVAGPTLEPRLVADIFGDELPLILEPVDAEVATSFSVVDPRHPIFYPFGGFVGTLGQVRVQRALRVVETPGTQVLARFEDGTAALAEYTVHQGRAVVFATDLNNDWNDFPRRPTFLPFVYELVQYLAADREEPRELTVTDVPFGLEPKPGPATLPGSGRRVVVNVDPLESETTSSSVDTFLSHVRFRESGERLRVAHPREATRESEQSYWWYAVLAMLLVLVTEAWLGRYSV